MTDLLGTVVRVQVQTAPLKPRPSGSGRYDPAPLREVEALELTEQGCVGLLGEQRLLDVHHVQHPDSRNRRQVNGISLLPRGHYAALRSSYGAHVVDGAAGENVLLDVAGVWSVADLAGELFLDVDGAELPLAGVMAAPPCVEFSRWCLGRDGAPEGALDDELSATLEHLGGGMRGFYLQTSGSAVLRPGHRLLRR